MMENLRKILDTNREAKRRIQTLSNEYQNFLADFIKDLQAIPKTDLRDEYDFQNFSLGFGNPFTFDHIQLAVCGPNSSGKTSFIHNFLQIGAILPATAGPVSARIVKLTHGSAKKACLNVYPSINAGLAQEEREIHINLSQFFEQKTNPNWLGIRNEISIHLERPNDLSEEEFTNWARRFVEIEIPSPVLELGIDIYDTPGFLFYDKDVLKENLHELVQAVEPMLIFMYENPSVASDANDCFLALQSILKNLAPSVIFFLNTKQDIKTLFDGAGINVSQSRLITEQKFYEILPEEREKRLKLLLNHPVMSNYLHRHKMVENFDICSLPKARSALPECANRMTGCAILRIMQFAVDVDLERPNAVVKKIMNSIDDFFQFSLAASHRDRDQWDKIGLDAQTWGVTFFEKFEKEMAVRIDSAYSNILRYFDQCSENICERAVKRDRCDDPLTSKAPQITKYSIKQFIEIAVQEEVIRVAVNEIINLTKDALRLSLKHEISIHSEQNELLLAAQRKVLIDISATELEQRTWLENILFNLSLMPTTISRLIKGIRIRCDVEYWNKAKRDSFGTEKKYEAYNEALDFFEDLIDPEKRKDFAESYLQKMKTSITDQETLFKRNLRDWIEKRKKIFFENIQANYQLAIKHLSARKSAYEKTKLFTGQFARIQCELLAVKHYSQKFHGQLPIIHTSIVLGQGAFFIIHPAQWGEEENLVVKKLKPSSVDLSNLQHLEAHYHRKITNLAIPNVVPLLYLAINPNNENELWLFLPRYRQSLAEYLQSNIQTMKSDQILKIALDIAHVLLKLHSYEIVHQDLKSNSILLDENEQCYLSNFGAYKQTTLNDTIVSSSTEIFPNGHDLGSNRNEMAVDIYSFGILLYELLPKLQYHRPNTIRKNIDVKELLGRVSRFDINGNEYELLIEACLAKKVEQRPTAFEVVRRLEKIRRILEQKLCTICETRARKYRYNPCRHKLLCEICHNQLEKNDQNQVQCILCQKIVQKWEEDDSNETLYSKT